MPATRTDKIKRPSNSWMLYKTDASKPEIREKIEALYGKPGKATGLSWPQMVSRYRETEPEDVKKKYKDMAKNEAILHKLKYPNYKFQPQKKDGVQKKKGAGQIDEAELVEADEDFGASSSSSEYGGHLDHGAAQSATHIPQFVRNNHPIHYNSISPLASTSTASSSSFPSTPFETSKAIQGSQVNSDSSHHHAPMNIVPRSSGMLFSNPLLLHSNSPSFMQRDWFDEGAQYLSGQSATEAESQFKQNSLPFNQSIGLMQNDLRHQFPSPSDFQLSPLVLTDVDFATDAQGGFNVDFGDFAQAKNDEGHSNVVDDFELVTDPSSAPQSYLTELELNAYAARAMAEMDAELSTAPDFTGDCDDNNRDHAFANLEVSFMPQSAYPADVASGSN